MFKKKKEKWKKEWKTQECILKGDHPAFLEESFCSQQHFSQVTTRNSNLLLISNMFKFTHWH